jgi:hypothetical protein
MNIFAAWKSLKCCNTFVYFFMRARGANGAHHQIFVVVVVACGML